MEKEQVRLAEEQFEPQEHSNRMRQTSLEAFQAIKSEGLLSGMRLRVYELLYHRGPLTGREVNSFLEGVSYHKRLSELERVGVAGLVGRRKCSITGRLAVEWDVTDAMPTGQPKTVAKPTDDDITHALNLIRGWYRRETDETGTAPPESFARVMRWLASQVKGVE